MPVLFDVIQVSPVVDGKQSVSLPDNKKGVYKTVVTTPEKVDEFLSERKQNDVKSAKNQLVSFAAGAVLGGVIGFAGKFIKESSRLVNGAAGALFGTIASLFPVLYFAVKYENDNKKINEKFIADNSK